MATQTCAFISCKNHQSDAPIESKRKGIAGKRFCDDYCHQREYDRVFKLNQRLEQKSLLISERAADDRSCDNLDCYNELTPEKCYVGKRAPFKDKLFCSQGCRCEAYFRYDRRQLVRNQQFCAFRYCKKELDDSSYIPLRGDAAGRGLWFCDQRCCEYEASRTANQLRDPAIKKVSKWQIRLKRYGLTQETFDKLWDSQEGKCPGCLRSLNLEDTGSWAIDHDHYCPKCSGEPPTCGLCTRGILCHGCNGFLGKTKDSPDTLRRLADYQESYLTTWAQ